MEQNQHQQNSSPEQLQKEKENITKKLGTEQDKKLSGPNRPST